MVTTSPLPVEELNQLSRTAFIQHVGPAYESSPWIAGKAFDHAPFASADALEAALATVVAAAPAGDQLALVNAHPDLAGRLASQGALTRESTHEQAAAGLASLDPATAAELAALNRDYRARFGFPFVICARLNNIATILAALRQRLANPRDDEMATALAEIRKIARLRLADIVS